jgi:serine/threonine-protein kinase RsbW
VPSPPERTQRLQFPAEPTAVQRAREALRDALTDAQVDAARQRDALLIVSELITNAIQHGSGTDDEIELSWHIDGGMLGVCVTDAARARRTPIVLTPDEERPDGRGLRIVDQLADAWHERIVAGRREVTFKLRLE